jgi:hypothetical protein
VRDLTALVDKHFPGLSMRKQCELLGVARSSVDYHPVAESAGCRRVRGKNPVQVRVVTDELARVGRDGSGLGQHLNGRRTRSVRFTFTAFKAVALHGIISAAGEIRLT